MPRPRSGTARENVVSTRLSPAEYRALTKQAGGNRSAWLRQAVRAQLGIAPMGTPPPPLPAAGAAATPPAPSRHQEPPPKARKPRRIQDDHTPLATHRHRRQRVGEKWVGGVDVGEWKCADPDCGVTLGILQ